MKPILVTSQAEWDRLAPVLEKQRLKAYVYNSGVKKSPRVLFLNDPSKDFYTWTFASMYKGETQTVDEYLLNASLLEMGKVALKAAGAPEDTPIYPTTAFNHKNFPPFCFKEPFPTNYQALYEAQTRAIEEALEEMEKKEMEYANKMSQTDIERGIELGYERAKEILPQKLK